MSLVKTIIDFPEYWYKAWGHIGLLSWNAKNGWWVSMEL